jgi:universal stress protein E
MRPRKAQTILVAVRDPAARQQAAIRKASRMAAASGARLTLFHSFATPYPLPDPLPKDPAAVIAAVGRARQSQLLQLAKAIRTKGVQVTCEVAWDFPVAQAIVRRVLAGGVSMVMADSHRRSRIARWFLANTDWELIRECPCPVWFVKHDRPTRRPLILAAVDPTHAHAKPAGLDGRLVQTAEQLATELGGRAAVIHVDDVRSASAAGGPGRAPGGRPAVLASIRRLGERHGIPPARQVIQTGVPDTVIARAVEALQVDLLVMGAISRSGLRPAFIGSTAEAVIDEVACDVLVVKPRGYRTAVPRTRPRMPTV